MTSLKEGYSEEYKYSCFGIALIVILFSPQLVSALESWTPQTDIQLASLMGYAAFLALVYVLGIILDSVIPYPIKDWLLYPSVRGLGIRRPGCKIFERIESGKAKDFRFDSAEAKKLYSRQIAALGGMESKDAAKYQNSEWYCLYRRYAVLSSVKANHLSFLYCRDLFTLSFVVLVTSLLVNAGCCNLGVEPLIGCFSIWGMLLIAVVSWFSAHSKAKRLVLSVIACDMAENRGCRQKRTKRIRSQMPLWHKNNYLCSKRVARKNFHGSEKV